MSRYVGGFFFLLTQRVVEQDGGGRHVDQSLQGGGFGDGEDEASETFRPVVTMGDEMTGEGVV